MPRRDFVGHGAHCVQFLRGEWGAHLDTQETGFANRHPFGAVAGITEHHGSLPIKVADANPALINTMSKSNSKMPGRVGGLFHEEFGGSKPELRTIIKTTAVAEGEGVEFKTGGHTEHATTKGLGLTKLFYSACFVGAEVPGNAKSHLGAFSPHEKGWLLYCQSVPGQNRNGRINMVPVSSHHGFRWPSGWGSCRS